MIAMSALRSTIARLAEEFASKVLAALGGASLSDLSAFSGSASPPPRRSQSRASRAVPSDAKRAPRLARARTGARRTAADFERITSAVVDLLQKHPDGLRAEQIQKDLGLSRKDLPRPMAHALAANLIRKKGHKRATKYFAR